MQKYKKYDLVRIDEDLGPTMNHFKFLLAKLFGKKLIGVDCGKDYSAKVIIRYYKGQYYITNMKYYPNID